MPDDKKLVSDDEVAAGAVVNVMEYLKGIDFPAGKMDVLNCAERNGADESALAEIRHLPDKRYEDPGDLIQAIGQEVKDL